MLKIVPIAVLAAGLGIAGSYWGGHRNGLEDCQRDAKAAQADAVVAGIEAANDLAAADLERAVSAERKRADARIQAAKRDGGLQESIRTEVVYRDLACVLPAPDRLRINDALAAARGGQAGAASRSDGAVLGAVGPAHGNAGGSDDQTARDGGIAGRVPNETR